MSVIAQFAIFPVDKGDSVSSYVAESIRIIENSGLPHKTGPMGTSIEGEWQDIIKVISECFESMQKESSRVYMTLNADYRKDKKNRMNGKIKSLEEKLARKIDT